MKGGWASVPFELVEVLGKALGPNSENYRQAVDALELYDARVHHVSTEPTTSEVMRYLESLVNQLEKVEDKLNAMPEKVEAFLDYQHPDWSQRESVTTLKKWREMFSDTQLFLNGGPSVRRGKKPRNLLVFDLSRFFKDQNTAATPVERQTFINDVLRILGEDELDLESLRKILQTGK